MQKLDTKIARALCVLQSQSPDDYLVLRQWFMDSSAEQDRLLRNADAPHVVYRAQGASKELLDVCELLASPQDLLAKLSKEKAGIRSV